jgi:hypothetical protein
MRPFTKGYFTDWHISNSREHLFKESHNPSSYKQMCLYNARFCHEKDWEPIMAAHGAKLFDRVELKTVSEMCPEMFQSSIRTPKDPMITMVLYGSYMLHKKKLNSSEPSRQLLQYVPVYDSFQDSELAFQVAMVKPPVVFCLNDVTSTTNGSKKISAAISAINSLTEIAELDALRKPMSNVKEVLYCINFRMLSPLMMFAEFKEYFFLQTEIMMKRKQLANPCSNI